MSKKFLEIETKYNADGIDRMQFKMLAKSLTPKSFTYVESTDVYYSKGDGDDFVRFRMPPENDKSKRCELTLKKKHVEQNNLVRTEVNLRVDSNSIDTINAFCQGLGYTKNFSVYKSCDIYFYEKCDVVFYTVLGEDNKINQFVEIEVYEDLDISQEEAKEIIQDYEKKLVSLGINAQKRMKRSLWEIYKKEVKSV